MHFLTDKFYLNSFYCQHFALKLFMFSAITVTNSFLAWMLWQMDHNITNSCANAFQRFINGWSHDCFAPFAVSIVVTRVDVVNSSQCFFFRLFQRFSSHKSLYTVTGTNCQYGIFALFFANVRQWMHVFINDRVSAHGFIWYRICFWMILALLWSIAFRKLFC